MVYPHFLLSYKFLLMTDYDLLNDFEDEEISDEEINFNVKKKKYKAKQFILLTQIVFSILIIALALIIKFFDFEYLKPIKNWYLENINNSLIAGNDIENYKDVFKQNVLSKNEFAKNKWCRSEMEVIKPIDLSVGLTKPLLSGKITSHFGNRIDPITKKDKTHYGLDISANKGEIIHAVLPGTVKKAEKIGSYGNCVVIDHGNNIETLYAHCDQIMVAAGTDVKRGQELALVGSSGRSTGSHLHFELMVNGIQYDPEQFLKGNYAL